MPERIQLSRKKGWRMPPNTVKVDRSTKWGNPFHTHGDGYRMAPELAVQAFRELLAETGAWWPYKVRVPKMPPTTVEEARAELWGKNLACWCPPGQPCHADVLLEIANRPPPQHGGEP